MLLLSLTLNDVDHYLSAEATDVGNINDDISDYNAGLIRKRRYEADIDEYSIGSWAIDEVMYLLQQVCYQMFFTTEEVYEISTKCRRRMYVIAKDGKKIFLDEIPLTSRKMLEELGAEAEDFSNYMCHAAICMYRFSDIFNTAASVALFASEYLLEMALAFKE